MKKIILAILVILVLVSFIRAAKCEVLAVDTLSVKSGDTTVVDTTAIVLSGEATLVCMNTAQLRGIMDKNDSLTSSLTKSGELVIQYQERTKKSDSLYQNMAKVDSLRLTQIDTLTGVIAVMDSIALNLKSIRAADADKYKRLKDSKMTVPEKIIAGTGFTLAGFLLSFLIGLAQ